MRLTTKQISLFGALSGLLLSSACAKQPTTPPFSSSAQADAATLTLPNLRAEFSLFDSVKTNGALSIESKVAEGCLESRSVTPPDTDDDTFTVRIPAGEFVNISAYAERGRYTCGYGLNFIPKANADYEMSFQMLGSSCSIRVYENAEDGSRQIVEGLPNSAASAPTCPKS